MPELAGELNPRPQTKLPGRMCVAEWLQVVNGNEKSSHTTVREATEKHRKNGNFIQFIFEKCKIFSYLIYGFLLASGSRHMVRVAIECSHSGSFPKVRETFLFEM